MLRPVIWPLLALVLSPFSASAGDPDPVRPADSKQIYPRPEEIEALLKAVTRRHENSFSLSVENSVVVVKTPGINSVVAKGIRVVPILAEAMKSKTLSFDAFTRLYSTCDQILRNSDPLIHVHWTGGCNELRGAEGEITIVPFGQIDGPRFRNWVIEDILRQYGRIKPK